MKDEKNTDIVSKVRLKDSDDNGEFRPFVVNYKSNPILKNIIKAFNVSNQVKLGYSTITKDKGIVEPTLKRKNIYLTGGALRDHLKNKSFTNYDCVTEASPDEIRKILQLKFLNLDEVRPDTHDIEIVTKYKKLSEKGQKKKCFYASRWDQAGHEIELTVEIDGQKVFITPFSFHVKDRMVSPFKRDFATTIEEDAKTRDLTINALYLKLKNDDGENGELSDPEGGIHDLKNGKITIIGSTDKLFAKDPYLPFRICLLAARYSPDKKVPEEIESKIKKMADVKFDPKSLKRIYLSAISNIDIPAFYYIKNLEDCGLLQKLFPHMHFASSDLNLPSNKILATAFILHKNEPEAVRNSLVSRGFSTLDADNISNLIKLAHFSATSIIRPDMIYEIFTKPFNLSNSKIKEFMKMIGKQDVYDKLFDGKLDDVVRKYVEKNDVRQINPLYIKHMGKTLRPDELEPARKHIFHHKVHELMGIKNDKS